MAAIAPIENGPVAEITLLNVRDLSSVEINGCVSEPDESKADDWLLWQLADSAFPTGGFAHSGGLEAAWQHKEIRSSAELVEFIQASLTQLAHGMLPFMSAAHDHPNDVDELDAACDSFLTNHVANRASRLQGRALLSSATRIFGETRINMTQPPNSGHLAPVFGVVTGSLGVKRLHAMRLFLFWHLRGWFASAVRLGIIGPIEAQSLQFNQSTFNENLLNRFGSCDLTAIAQTAPLLEIFQASQDRLYSRLFQS